MAGEEEDRPKFVKRYTQLAVVAAFLLALLWKLGGLFFWIFFGATAFFAFMAFYYRPRVVRNEERFSYPKFSGQGQAQTPPPKVPPKNIRLIIIGVIISFFAMFVILTIIGIATGDEEVAQTVEETAPNDRAVVQSDPTNLDALTNLGNSFYVNGQYDSALWYYDRVLSIDPANSGGLYNKGLVFYQKKDYQKSMDVLRKCISLYPNNADAIVVMGDNYYSQNKFNEALIWYKQGYDKGERSAGLLNIMAYIYDQQNRKTEAIRFYKETLQQDSSLVDVYNRLAELEPGRAEWYKKKSEDWK